MTAKVKPVERLSSTEVATPPFGDHRPSFLSDSPVAGLQRQIARHFGETGGTAQLVLERLPMEEVLLHGLSRTIGVAALVLGYAVAGVLISQMF